MHFYFPILILILGSSIFVLSQIHVGSFCVKHEDCIRYCSYSRHGVKGASCCLPEKIRVSRNNWIKSGSNTCYCCPLPDLKHLHEKREGSNSTSAKGLTEANATSTCPNESLNAQERSSSDNDLIIDGHFGGVHYCDHYLQLDTFGEEESSAEGGMKIEEGMEPGVFNLDVTQEFCSRKCVQAMINMKVAFEHPSLCRARKLPNVLGNKHTNKS